MVFNPSWYSISNFVLNQCCTTKSYVRFCDAPILLKAYSKIPHNLLSRK